MNRLTSEVPEHSPRQAAAALSQRSGTPNLAEQAPPASADGAGLGYAPRMNRLPLLTLAVAGLVLAISPCLARAQAHADTILVDGKVWTGNPAQPEAEAVAILDGKVAAVGSDAEVRRWAGPAKPSYLHFCRSVLRVWLLRAVGTCMNTHTAGLRPWSQFEGAR